MALLLKELAAWIKNEHTYLSTIEIQLTKKGGIVKRNDYIFFIKNYCDWLVKLDFQWLSQ